MFGNEYMQEAYLLACKAYKMGEVPVGAVIVIDNKIISRAHNQVETLKNPIAHAEMIAIEQATALISDKYLENAELYVTLEPCPMCAHAISLARIKKIYFAAGDEKSGGVEHGAKVFNAKSCHHHPEVIGGIMEQECSHLIKKFFSNLRK